MSKRNKLITIGICYFEIGYKNYDYDCICNIFRKYKGSIKVTVQPAPFAKSRQRRFPAASQLTLLIIGRSAHKLYNKQLRASMICLSYSLCLNC